MTSPGPRLPALLLVVLLMTWGTCPCVFAQMLGLKGGKDTAVAEAPASTAPC
jgi:hypothetical protein